MTGERLSRSTFGAVPIVTATRSSCNRFHRESLPGMALESDSAPLDTLLESMVRMSSDIQVRRDAALGAVASSLHEVAAASGVGIRIDKRRLPVKPQFADAREMLGFDRLYVAIEGKLPATLAPADMRAVLECTQPHTLGQDAAIIGRASEEHPGMQIGEQLPRIP